MAIAVMRKLRVAAISYEGDKILDALSKTGAAEIKILEAEENIARPVSDAATLSSRLEEAEGALKELVASSERYAKEHKKAFKPEKDGFFVTYEEFMNAEKREEAEALIAEIKRLAAERVRLSASLASLEKTILSLSPYKEFEILFFFFLNTPR